MFGGSGVSGDAATSLCQSATTGLIQPFVGNPTSAIAEVSGYTLVGWQVIVMTYSTVANGTGLDREVIVAFKSGLAYGPPGSNYLQQSMTFPGSATYNLFTSGGCNMGNIGFNGDIAEAVFWRNGLTLAQRIAAGKKLADLYGIPY